MQVGICIDAKKELVIVKGELETAQRKLADRRDPSYLSKRWRGRGADGTAEYQELKVKYESERQEPCKND